jgi:hypothetical protein
MWTYINLQHKKPEKIFGCVLEYYGGQGGEYKKAELTCLSGSVLQHNNRDRP